MREKIWRIVPIYERCSALMFVTSCILDKRVRCVYCRHGVHYGVFFLILTLGNKCPRTLYNIAIIVHKCKNYFLRR